MTNRFKAFLIDVFLIIALIISEAWVLREYFKNTLDFEPVLTFIGAFIAVLSSSKIIDVFGLKDNSKNHDQSLFSEFQELLPFEPTIRVLKEHDFGDAFRRETISPLNSFSIIFDSVDKEFLDKKLEIKRKEFLAEAKSLASEIATRTVPLRDNTFASVYSDAQRNSRTGARPAHIVEDARILNVKATSFVQKYERFIRYCKKRLNR